MTKIEESSQTSVNGEAVSYLGAKNLSLIQIALLSLAIIFIARNFVPAFDNIPARPVGFRSVFEPAFLVRLRFAKGALPQINEGYRKFKDSLFRICRNDRDIVVISRKYVDELRNLSGEQLSLIQALYAVRHLQPFNVDNFANNVGDYTGLSIFLEGHLHTTTIQSKLTPNLPKLTPIMKDEIDLALPTAVPDCEDQWVEVRIYEIVLKLVARISNRILLGDPDCYDEDWAQASMAFAENVTLTMMILRLFPPLLRPFIALITPPAWKVQKNLRKAKRILAPIIEERRRAEKDSLDYQKPDDFLQWMMDGANEDESHPDKLAHRQLIVFLGAAHTTTMAGAHVMYDLCAMPSYVEPLRAEISALLKEEGGWSPAMPNKMRKMDSFLRESQRVNPPSLLGFHRIVQTPLTLSDGLQLPAGTHICTAAYAISKDPANLPNPQDFDGFRYYEKRRQPDEEYRHQYAVTDKDHMHFGHGKLACPGRFFASSELKIIVAHLIMEYDFTYPEGKTRPENLNADEFLYPDPSARLLIKRRSKT